MTQSCDLTDTWRDTHSKPGPGFSWKSSGLIIRVREQRTLRSRKLSEGFYIESCISKYPIRSELRPGLSELGSDRSHVFGTSFWRV